ncbi:MAG: Ig-like domain-containing protein [Gemmatimonadaceae bacterium]|nr:Ig-like domain-containing protein [Gemmatimonadaceae bacterium]
MTVSPSSLNMAPGQSTPLTATALDNTGAPISGRTATWTTANTAIATVSSSGVVTAVTDGVTSITATINGRAGSAAVVVRTPVVSVAVSPATAQLTVGGPTVQLTATPRDPAGAALAGRTVAWSSASPTIATVSSSGVVTALAAGTASILATSEGVSGNATITVAPDPCTVVRPIAVGETVSNSLSTTDCRIADSTAVQRYEFVVTEPTKIEITMNSTAFDAYLFLTNAAFSVIAEDDDGGVGVNARILRTIPAGRYYVVANAYDATRFGAYQLTVRTAPAACVLGRSTAVPSTTDATLSSTTSCRQNDESFEDRYEVVVSTKSTLTMNLTSTAFDPVLIVMDASERVVVQDDDSGAGLNASLEVQLEAGRYIVLARGYPGETGAYRLAIAPAVNPCAVTRSIGIGQSIGSTFAVTDCALSEGGGPNRYFQRFAFSLPNTTAMQFDMVSSAVDPYLVLQNAVTEEILAENDDASVSTRNARIAINLPPGQYIINTTTYNLAEIGFYQLTATGITTAGSVNVTVSPTSVTLQPGQTQQAVSNVTGAANTAVNWQSSAPNVASVSSSGFIRALTPGSALITATSEANPSRSATVPVTVGQSDGTTNLDIAALYLVQSVQQLDGRVPLVADRGAVARVFVRGSRTGLAAATVRVRIVQNATVTGTFTGTATPTLAVDEACCSANIQIPLALIKPGISVLADVDPNNTVTESNESDNFFPLSGTPQALNVVTVPPFNVRFVPVQQNRNGPLGVAQPTILNVFLSAWPLSATNATVRAPLVIDYVIGSQNFDDWIRLVRDVEIARQTEGSTSFYYGLVRTRGTSGVLGLANGIPARTAIGVDEGSDFGAAESRLTFAHEMGHTLGLRHAPCGGAAGPDPAYPFADGRTGVYGMDTFNGNVIKLPNSTDLMTYCPNQWVSAYNYRKVLDFRQANPNGAGIRAPTDVLVISGGVSRTGVTLDPAFAVQAPPATNDANGRFIVEGFDNADRRLFSYRFSPYAVSDAGAEAEAFVVAVPVAPLLQGQLARMRVREVEGTRASTRLGTSAGIRSAPSLKNPADVAVVRGANGRSTMTWSSAHVPAVMVRDRTTGEVLAILRNGAVDLSQFGARREVDVLVSNGVGSTRVIVEPSTGAIRQ